MQLTDKKFFYETYHWLVVSTNESTRTLFERVKLNINSDVHLAVIGDGENITIHDVYNPASEHGGELKISYLGYYNDVDGYNAKIKENKYWKRRNVTGVTFKSAVVVIAFNFPFSFHAPSTRSIP